MANSPTTNILAGALALCYFVHINPFAGNPETAATWLVKFGCYLKPVLLCSGCASTVLGCYQFARRIFLGE